MADQVTSRIGQTKLVILIGDVTKQKTDAIVNAANSSLRGGGGVDGAIHRVGGPTIDKECQEYVSEHGALPPGKAMWTHGGNLPARYVIHTVGPIYKSEEGSAPVLRSAYEESLKLAEGLNLKSVSFPSISTGAYGYPVKEAARAALQAITEHLRDGSSLELIQIVCFTDSTLVAYEQATKTIGNA